MCQGWWKDVRLIMQLCQHSNISPKSYGSQCSWIMLYRYQRLCNRVYTEIQPKLFNASLILKPTKSDTQIFLLKMIGTYSRHWNTKEPKRTTGLYRRIETDQSLRSHLELSQFCLLLLPEGSPIDWEVYAISCQDKHAISWLIFTKVFQVS